MTHAAPALRIPLARARAHWHQMQGLAEPVTGPIDEVVAATGWPRTLGGVDVYLAVRARVPGMRRRDLDEAVEQGKLQVIPAVRGCIYLVPRTAVPVVMRIAEEQYRKRAEREHAKAGLTPKELGEVGAAVLVALGKGPMTTDALRKALPQGLVRSLGEAGKKVGISSPLPPALRELEFAGKVERTLEGGRLDTERYLWRIPPKNPFDGSAIPEDALERHALLALAFLHHAGPVTVKDFAEWAGLGQREARAALGRVPAVPVEVEGYADEAYVLTEDLPELEEPAPPAPRFTFLPFEDNYITLHGGPALLSDPRHHERKMPVWGHTRGSTLGDAKHISMRVLCDGDRLVGLWEYEPDQGTVVFGTFHPLPAARRREVTALAEELGAFLRDEIGHARSFSLDTTDAVRERAQAIQAM